MMHVLSVDSCDFSGFSLTAGCSPPEGLGETKAGVYAAAVSELRSLFSHRRRESRGVARDVGDLPYVWRVRRQAPSHLCSFLYSYNDSVLSEIRACDQQSVF